jgi:16S rRNA (cytidine1402-2'-O)-methyltransferase
MSILYIVATPIGNLKDITLRALEVLNEVDLILAEDTRLAKKLLSHYKIHKPIKRYDENIKEKIHPKIADYLLKDKKIALLSDAGTPVISDPGAKLIDYLLENVSSLKVVPIPGASALTAALSVAGIVVNEFTFVGYPPRKKKRQKFFNQLKEIKIKPVVLYESPHRLEKTLKDLIEVFGNDSKIIIARELTKIYEEIFRGTIKQAKLYFVGNKVKGEFVVILP